MSLGNICRLYTKIVKEVNSKTNLCTILLVFIYRYFISKLATNSFLQFFHLKISYNLKIMMPSNQNLYFIGMLCDTFCEWISHFYVIVGISLLFIIITFYIFSIIIRPIIRTITNNNVIFLLLYKYLSNKHSLTRTYIQVTLTQKCTCIQTIQEYF